jgi:hypothetical protein
MFISRGYRVPVMTLTAQTLLAELDTTLSEVSQDWRTAVLRQIADLYLSGADLYSKDQVALFDAVMSLLLPGVDRPTLAELSNRLAGVPLPPAMRGQRVRLGRYLRRARFGSFSGQLTICSSRSSSGTSFSLASACERTETPAACTVSGSPETSGCHQ